MRPYLGTRFNYLFIGFTPFQHGEIIRGINHVRQQTGSAERIKLLGWLIGPFDQSENESATDFIRLQACDGIGSKICNCRKWRVISWVCKLDLTNFIFIGLS